MNVFRLPRPAAPFSYTLHLAARHFSARGRIAYNKTLFDYYVKLAQCCNETSFSTVETARLDILLVYSAFAPAFNYHPATWGKDPSTNFNATLGPSHEQLD